MKKIAIISLSVLILAACSSSNYDSEVSSDSYQENYNTDVQQPITDSSGATNMEQDVSTAAVSNEAMANTQSVTTEPQVATDADKHSTVPPQAQTPAQDSSSVRVFYPQDGKSAELTDDSYVIQVAALTSEENLRKLAANLPENQPKWENVKSVKGKQYYSLLFGNFKSSQDAKDAIMRLPASMHAISPFVKSVSSIKQSDFPTIKAVK